MKAVATALEGVLVIEPDIHRDGRGFFLEVYRKEVLHGFGIDDEFVQDNHSRSTRGVLRGLHFQDLTAPMAKLVRCSLGSIYDVAVDLRVGSPQFGRWVGAELTGDNMRQLYVPVGFGHGFVTLSDEADVQYKCSGYYAPAAERVLAWNDPELNINWPIEDPTVSARDRQGLSLAAYRADPAFRYSDPRA